MRRFQRGETAAEESQSHSMDRLTPPKCPTLNAPQYPHHPAPGLLPILRGNHAQTEDPAGTMTGACPASPSCFLFSGPVPPARSCLGELESGSTMEICP
ncbi:TPA: hypothetical protein BOS_7403 [Bos taurus]|nr:TPA: hypothetical protein BOS_7403 [Bos taurus]